MTEINVSARRASLPRFEEAEGLGPRDAEFVRDLVAVLARHGNLDRFGLCLLHDHFPLADDEVLVETNDSGARTLQAHVEKTDGTRHTKASQWRFLSHAEGGRGAEPDDAAYQVLQLCTTLDLCPGREHEEPMENDGGGAVR
ncbi:hypothetical protein J2Z21_002089 [Streptomyces griseochromogenes]|uniref:Uncharacterized protein n=1 Tax=Streptomyces griseochromogenes TaxID=68214 RepID=A0A1B1ARV9_9ACTN|nr:hypothetical protein [Streptomyces griseochromogenes]ANP49285.1 hypothetical protein AVL59_06485 [Streptomyces griseochromogenes]MBP2049158.1 hypothetical protein [Streptomyces griseochromogenes]